MSRSIFGPDTHMNDSERLREFCRLHPETVAQVRRSRRDYFQQMLGIGDGGGVGGGEQSASQWAERIAGTGLEQEVLTQLRSAHARRVIRAGEEYAFYGEQAPSRREGMDLAGGMHEGYMGGHSYGGGGADGLDDELDDDCFEAGNVDLLNEGLREMLCGEEVKAMREHDMAMMSWVWEQEREMREMDEQWAEVDEAAAACILASNPDANKGRRGRGRRSRGRGRGRRAGGAAYRNQ